MYHRRSQLSLFHSSLEKNGIFRFVPIIGKNIEVALFSWPCTSWSYTANKQGTVQEDLEFINQDLLKMTLATKVQKY